MYRTPYSRRSAGPDLSIYPSVYLPTYVYVYISNYTYTHVGAPVLFLLGTNREDDAGRYK